MKRFSAFCLSLLLVSCGLLAKGEEDLELALLKEVLMQRDSYEYISADIIQEKKIPSLAAEVSTKGKLWMVPQKAFRWEQGSPVSDIAFLDGKDVYLYDKKEMTYEKHDADSRKARPIMLLLGMGKDASYNGLLDNFKPVKTAMIDDKYTVDFLPDSGLMKRAVSALSITFHLETAFPTEVVWEQKDGTVITTRFLSPNFESFGSEIFERPEGDYVKK